MNQKYLCCSGIALCILYFYYQKYNVWKSITVYTSAFRNNIIIRIIVLSVIIDYYFYFKYFEVKFRSMVR